MLEGCWETTERERMTQYERDATHEGESPERMRESKRNLPTGLPRSSKIAPPLGKPYDPRYSPSVGSYAGGVSYE